MHRLWKLQLVCIGLLAAWPLAARAGITTATPVNVGSDGGYLETGSQANVVVHIPITASGTDTLHSITIINPLLYGNPAAEPVDLAANSVRLWYVGADTGTLNTVTANFLGVFTRNGSAFNPTWDLAFSGPGSPVVGNGSALYVTVDITSAPTLANSCNFVINQDTTSLVFGSGPYVMPDPYDPTNPPALYISAYTPATLVSAAHAPASPLTLSTGQSFAAMVLTFSDTGTPLTAPALLTGLTLTVRDGNGALIAPNTALNALGLSDADTGLILSQVFSLPSAPGPCFLPLTATVTAVDTRRLQVFGTVCSNTATAVSAFRLDWTAAADLSAQDAYSGRPLAVSPNNDDFPMLSSIFSVQTAPDHLTVAHVSALPPNSVVIKGQTGVNPINFVFRNPGNTGTANIDITRLLLSVTDAQGVTLTPATVFSRVALTSAASAVVYGETSALPNTGSIITLALTKSFCSVPVNQSVTAYVQADIRPDASAINFKLSLPSAASIRAQDSNNIKLALPVAAAYASDPFPMVSNTIRIASSFQVQGQSLASKTLYPGQRARLLNLIFTHPGPADIGPLWLQGITLTARDRAGAPLNLAANAASVSLVDSSVVTVSQAVPLSASTIYLPLNALYLAPFSVYTLQVNVQMLDHPQDTGLSLGLADLGAVAATQVNDPSRPVYVAGAWPIMSTLASVGGGEGQLRLSNYPNPFTPARSATQIAYYLTDNATVSASVFTLSGDRVRSLCVGALQTIGEHILAWDGRTESGPVVVNGVYLLRIEAVTLTTKQNIVQLRKIAVVK